MTGSGRWSGSTAQGGKDACLLSSLPLYFAVPDSPLVTGMKKIIYFEVKIISYGRGRGVDASSLALGYCAMPYPTWRMPGWERGSLAVHGDDGRRYVNDTWGGKDFTSAIKAGETVGLGMEFSIPDTPPSYGSSPAETPKMKVDLIFTRNGAREGAGTYMKNWMLRTILAWMDLRAILICTLPSGFSEALSTKPASTVIFGYISRPEIYPYRSSRRTRPMPGSSTREAYVAHRDQFSQVCRWIEAGPRCRYLEGASCLSCADCRRKSHLYGRCDFHTRIDYS